MHGDTEEKEKAVGTSEEKGMKEKRKEEGDNEVRGTA